MKKCVVLFSGGIDSTTALYWALKEYDEVHALTFDYGQRHRIEISFAEKITQKLNVLHEIISLDLRQIADSSLTDKDLPLPEFEDLEEIPPGPPSTYVPFRNGIFLAAAAAWSEFKSIRAIICGFNIIDSPDYPDTTAPFVEAMEKAINSGTSATQIDKFRVLAPFIGLKKSEIIQKGIDLGADYSYSLSCYSGAEIPCTRCSSCLLRLKAWEETGSNDPLLSRLHKEGKI
jgi:7-cyano-7-deazaguanine synthase